MLVDYPCLHLTGSLRCFQSQGDETLRGRKIGQQGGVWGQKILSTDTSYCISRTAEKHRHQEPAAFSAHTLTETGEEIWPLRKSLKQKVGPHSFHIHLLQAKPWVPMGWMLRSSHACA